MSDNVKDVVYGFIRDVEKCDNFDYSIPDCIFELCLLFYHIPYFPLSNLKQIPDNDSIYTPFTFLFAIYGMTELLRMKGWKLMDIQTQIKYLQEPKLDPHQTVTDLCKESSIPDLKGNEKIQNQLKYVLSTYHQTSQSLLRSFSDYGLWTDYEVMISFVYSVINHPEIVIKQSYSQEKNERICIDVWNKMNIVGQYIHDTKYDGKLLSKDIGQQSPTGYGLRKCKHIFSKYRLKSLGWVRIKRHFNLWSKEIFCRKINDYPHLLVRVASPDTGQFPYDKIDSAALSSILEPISKEVEIICVHEYCGKLLWSGRPEGIAILIYRKIINMTYSELLDILNDSVRQKWQWFVGDITLSITGESGKTTKYDAKEFQDYISKQDYDIGLGKYTLFEL